MTQLNPLQQAQNLTLPPREAMLQRAPSVQAFWDDNRKLLEQAWAQWESDTNVLVPDETLLDSRLRQAINDAWQDPSKESAVADLWQEIIPGVYQAQFFDPERLVDFREYLQATVDAEIPTRPPYGIALNRFGAMLDPRSVGYLGAPNFQAFYRDIMNRYMRPVARLLLGTYGYDNQTFGFSIQYDPDKDTSLNPHTDASSATMNVNINLPNEPFTGSEVDFYDNESKQTVRTVFESGVAMIHRGNVPHATHPITSGQRKNLVLWLYGEKMQVPRDHGASSYDSVDGAAPTVVDTDADTQADARQRWSVPDAPMDAFAPF